MPSALYSPSKRDCSNPQYTATRQECKIYPQHTYFRPGTVVHSKVRGSCECPAVVIEPVTLPPSRMVLKKPMLFRYFGVGVKRVHEYVISCWRVDCTDVWRRMWTCMGNTDAVIQRLDLEEISAIIQQLREHIKQSTGNTTHAVNRLDAYQEAHDWLVGQEEDVSCFRCTSASHL